ncbi:hypothetical protein [Hahella sp. NBU794]|uniref:hypothetical protein n=1 Tax=Hahella sp. NBU794 TaxID=3422590 RepID=UPI003D6E204E
MYKRIASQYLGSQDAKLKSGLLMPSKSKLVLICAVLAHSLAAPMANAEEKLRNIFSYKGEVNQIGKVGWEPTEEIEQEGFHISFFGAPDSAAGCPKTVRSGAVTSNIFWANLEEDTGLGLIDWDHQWSPMSDAKCKMQGWQGYAHAHLKNVPGGGIGLYTHTGPKPTDSSLAFFQPYTSAGDRNGVNAGVEGAFATFRNTPYMADSKLTRPFGGNSQDNDLTRVAIRTYQNLTKFVMEDPSSQQIRQQTVVTLLNKRCILESREKFKKCHMQILFMNAIAGQSAKQTYAQIFSDKAQGDIPAIYGDLGAPGQTTYAKDGVGNVFPVWTSWAAETQSQVWSGQKWFQGEVSFNQFLNMLKLATANTKKIANANSITAGQLNEYFGPAYDDKEQWILLDAGFAQEIYNVNLERRAYVGGNLTELSVIALPY